MPNYLVKKNGNFWLTEDEQDNLQISYRIKDVVYEEQSQFQHIMILDSYDFGRMLVLDGVVQTTSLDGYIYNEAITHVPIANHPDPKKVLVIGGGDCGAAKEVCKYDFIEQVDLVEIDKLVVKACKQFIPEVSGNLNDQRVHFIFEDGVAFVKNKTNEYDLIVVDSSDPVGPAQALFEKSFYSTIFHALKEDGLMVCQSQSPIFHQQVMTQTYQRISHLFHETKMYTAVVPTYPGGLWSFTMASKGSFQFDPTKLANIDTKYMNEPMIAQSFALPLFMQALKTDF